jgi:hypothetical protein
VRRLPYVVGELFCIVGDPLSISCKHKGHAHKELSNYSREPLELLT